MIRLSTLRAALFAALTAPALLGADNYPLSGREFAWGPSIGWINCKPSSQAGVQRFPGFLAGNAWSESSGWITFGDGTPADGVAYSQSGDDHGVNILGDGTLQGYAWCEGLGWITFDIGPIDPSAVPRIQGDGTATGYAWSEAPGWINLGDGWNGLAFEAHAGSGGFFLY